MLVGAAVVPAAPVLVPEVAAGAAAELDTARGAIDAALAVMGEQRPDVVVVVGAGERTVRHDQGARGTLRPVGVDLAFALESARESVGRPATPATSVTSSRTGEGLGLSLTIGAWLLTRWAWSGRVHGLEVARREAPQVCLGAGAGLADDVARVALLVVADGTARRGPTAPGYTDERSSAFDASWLGALGAADAQTLSRLDPALAEELMMSGRAPLQVLAGAAGAGRWVADLLYADDPYGVQYAVATWCRAAD